MLNVQSSPYDDIIAASHGPNSVMLADHSCKHSCSDAKRPPKAQSTQT